MYCIFYLFMYVFMYLLNFMFIFECKFLFPFWPYSDYFMKSMCVLLECIESWQSPYCSSLTRNTNDTVGSNRLPDLRVVGTAYEALNEGTVKRFYPGYFRTNAEQDKLQEVYSKLDLKQVERKYDGDHQCYFWCDSSSRRRRSWTYHGCCRS